MINLLVAFSQTFKSAPERTMMIVEGEKFSFRNVFESSYLLGSWLLKSPYKAPRVGILLPNSLEFAIAFFGIHHAGRTVVPFNGFLTPPELSVMVHHSEIDLLLTNKLLEPLARGVQKIGGWKGEVKLVEDCLSEQISILPPKYSSPNEMAVLLYTSGTTGDPKGVMLTHKNLSSNCKGAIKAFQFSENDTLMSVLPFFHSFGMTCVLLVSALCGAQIAVLQKYKPKDLFEYWKTFPGGVFLAVPAIMKALVKAAPSDLQFDPPPRFCVSGGAPLPSTTQTEFEERFGTQILEGYGLSEASPIVACNRPDGNRKGTVGKIIPGVQVEIRCPDFSLFPLGDEGEICVKGDNVMKGYLKSPELTQEVITPDGWLKTGDLGTLEDDGYLKVVGRVKDLIIVAGENIHPREIEEVLLVHPQIFETSVIGVPDEKKGETPVAFYSTLTEKPIPKSELQKFCRETLSAFKVPSDYLHLKEIPKNATGKISKNLLAKLI